jgi:2,3-dihydroxybenzoate decarboxylase
MDGKIAIEEHFVTPELEDLVLNPGWAPDAFRRTLDGSSADEHLAIMDRHGIAMAVLSLASDGIQGIDNPVDAVARAREANDALAARVALHPDRFAGFAAVALQDVAAAASEAERAVRELGFHGVLVNGYSNGAPYYDDERYLPFWEAIEGTRRAVLSAPAEPARVPARDLRRPPRAARPDVGVRRRDRDARAAADRERLCSTASRR